MTRRLVPLLAVVAALSLLLPVGATAQTVELVPTQHTIYFGVGCPPANPAGSCASTEYFLSRAPGSQNVGNLATGVAWAQRKLSGNYATDTFNPDDTLDDSYLLNAAKDITGQVAFGGYISGAEYAVDSGVEVTLSAHVEGDPSFVETVLGQAEITKLVVLPGDTVYEFTFDIPEELDEVRIDNLSADVGHNSATVLGNGFMNGSGNSFFKLPHYREVVTG